MKPVAPEQWVRFYGSHLQNFRKLNDRQCQSSCPFHDDRKPSFSTDIANGVFTCHAGCGSGGAIDFADKLGIPRSEIPGWEPSSHSTPRTVAGVYDYLDEKGTLLFRAVRYEPKDFRQMTPTASGGWEWGLNGARRVLFRLPELIAAKSNESMVFIPEGERDVETLRSNGFTATTSPMGALKWRHEYAESLRGFPEAFIIADKDEPGRKHAEQVAASVSKVVERVKVIELPGDAVKDASDWFGSGGTPQELMALVNATPIWQGQPAPPELIGGQPAADAEQPPRKRQLASRLETGYDLLTEPIQPVTWLIEGLWTDKSRGFIAGHPGVGKTWLALDLVMAIACGQKALGLYQVPLPLPCLLVEEESSREALKRRLQMLAKGRKINPSLVRDNLFLLTRCFVKILSDLTELTDLITQKRIKVVVFDSLRRLHDSDESSSNEMSGVLEALAKLQAQTGVSIILIHHLKKTNHQGKSGSIFEQLRGSSDLWAWRDCVIAVEANEDPQSATCHFQFRDADSPAPITLIRTPDEEAGSMILEAIPHDETDEFMEDAAAITEFLANQAGALSGNQIQKGVKIKRQEVFRVLKYLADQGKIQTFGSRNKTRWALKEGTAFRFPNNGNHLGTTGTEGSDSGSRYPPLKGVSEPGTDEPELFREPMGTDAERYPG